MSFDYDKYNDEYWINRIRYESKYGEYISKLNELFETKLDLDVQIYINEDHNEIPLFMTIQVVDYQDEQDLSFIEKMFNQKSKQKIKHKKCLSTHIDLTKYTLDEIYATLRLL